jgi:LSU ribosomal protein L12P
MEDDFNLYLRYKMADITKDQVVDFIANMSVLEMSELVKEMEKNSVSVQLQLQSRHLPPVVERVKPLLKKKLNLM